MSRRSTVALVLGGVLLAGGVAAAAWVYSALNPPLPKVARGRTIIAAIGDSNTFGAGVFFDDMRNNAYPARLEALLGRDHQVLNYGLSGRTLLDSGDMPFTDNAFFAHSHEVAPDTVLIMLGTNDSKPKNWNAARYEQDLTDFVDSYSALRNSPTIYLLTPPAAYENGAGIDPGVISDQIVPIIRRVARAHDAEVIDVHAATEGQPELFPDGVHPNAAGYAIIAETVFAALR